MQVDSRMLLPRGCNHQTATDFQRYKSTINTSIQVTPQLCGVGPAPVMIRTPTARLSRYAARLPETEKDAR